MDQRTLSKHLSRWQRLGDRLGHELATATVTAWWKFGLHTWDRKVDRILAAPDPVTKAKALLAREALRVLSLREPRS